MHDGPSNNKKKGKVASKIAVGESSALEDAYLHSAPKHKHGFKLECQSFSCCGSFPEDERFSLSDVYERQQVDHRFKHYGRNEFVGFSWIPFYHFHQNLDNPSRIIERHAFDGSG